MTWSIMLFISNKQTVLPCTHTHHLNSILREEPGEIQQITGSTHCGNRILYLRSHVLTKGTSKAEQPLTSHKGIIDPIQATGRLTKGLGLDAASTVQCTSESKYYDKSLSAFLLIKSVFTFLLLWSIFVFSNGNLDVKIFTYLCDSCVAGRLSL